MKKHTAIFVLGGNVQAAAQALGCTRQAVQAWMTDAHGNLTSRLVVNSVLAALVRMNYEHRLANPDGERFELDEDTLRDLMMMPKGSEVREEAVSQEQ